MTRHQSALTGVAFCADVMKTERAFGRNFQSNTATGESPSYMGSVACRNVSRFRTGFTGASVFFFTALAPCGLRGLFCCEPNSFDRLSLRLNDILFKLIAECA